MRKKSIIVIIIIISSILVNFFIFDYDIKQIKYDSKNQIFKFSNFLAKFKNRNKYGVINNTGKIVVPAIYEDIKIIKSNNKFILFKNNGEWNILNILSNKQNLKNSYEELDFINSQYIKAKNNNMWGIIDYDGEIKVPLNYNEIKKLDEKFFLIKKNEIMMLDKNYKYIKTMKGDNIFHISKDNYILKNKKIFTAFYFNEKIIIKENIKQIYKNYIIEKNKKNVIIKIFSGETIINDMYTGMYIKNLKNIAVKKNNKYGIIDINEKIIIPIIYNKISNIYRNIIITEKNGINEIFTTNGVKISNINYSFIEEIKGDLILVANEKGFGIINLKGELIIPIIYDSIFQISKKFFLVKNKNNIKILNKNNKIIKKFTEKEISSIYLNQINTKNNIFLFN